MAANAANTGLGFVADFLPTGQDGQGQDSRLSVECIHATTDGQTTPCATDSKRFSELISVGLQVAGGISTAFEMPLTGPMLPGAHGESRQLGFTRIQLLEDAPGWLFIETYY